MSAKFKQSQSNDGPAFDTVLKKKIRFWDGKLLDYSADRDESNRLVHEYYKQRYPKLTHIQLLDLRRFVLPEPSMMEIDETGTLDDKRTVKEALVWLTDEYVDEENYILHNGRTRVKTVSGGVFRHGVFAGVDPVYSYDNAGRITDAKIGSIRNIFYVPWKRSTAEKLIKEFGEPMRPSVVTVANPRGSHIGSQAVGNKSVKNLQEFLEADSALDLIDANNCLKLIENYGGFKEFLEMKANALKLGIPVKQLVDDAQQKQLAQLEAMTKNRMAQ